MFPFYRQESRGREREDDLTEIPLLVQGAPGPSPAFHPHTSPTHQQQRVVEVCLLIFRAVFLLCWKIIVVCLALELVGSCVELGFSVRIETLGELLSINVPWSQEFSDVVKFWT